MSTEAKPCPFCGGSDVGVFEGSTFRWMFAECRDCGAQAGEVRRQTTGNGTQAEWKASAEARAIEEWNKRATPAPAQPEPSPGAEGDVTSAQAVDAWNKLMEVTGSVFVEPEGNEVMRLVRTYAQFQYEAGLSAGAAAPAEGTAWQPIESVPGTQEPVLLWTHSGQMRVETGWYARNLLEESKEDGFECAFTHWRARLAAPTSPPQAAQEGKAS